MIKPLSDTRVMDHADTEHHPRRGDLQPSRASGTDHDHGNGNGNGNGRHCQERVRPDACSRTGESFGPMVGASAPMRSLYDAVTKVAPTEATALVIGESGTGKELVAQTIHRRSRRKDGPIVAVNCGAIPETLIESELFGHEKGAFTGATQLRKGVFERAEGGTLFLDEISEMPIELQVKLLRVLETERFTRIGGEGEHATDIRVIAATNCDPAEAVADGRLREDLLYRLSVFPLRVPPLRERRDDVPLLGRHFLTQVRRQEGDDAEGFHALEQMLERLSDYHWPGNVRELRNVVYRFYIMGGEHLDVSAMKAASVAAIHSDCGDTVRVSVGTALAQAERQLIYATLRHFDDNKKRTARTLGISLKTLYNRLNAYEAEAAGRP